ncbi:Uncharacterised protein [Collinsella intestinalis]|nr:Uncharacterised protein [Collinsella intestinalis]
MHRPDLRRPGHARPGYPNLHAHLLHHHRLVVARLHYSAAAHVSAALWQGARRERERRGPQHQEDVQGPGRHHAQHHARPRVARFHGRVLLLHRRRSHGHLHGHQLRSRPWHRLHPARTGASRHAVRGLPLGDHLRKARRPRGHLAHDHRRGGGLCGHRAVCRFLPQVRCGVLDLGRPGGHVPGWRPGAFSQLLRSSHPQGALQRVLRLL